MESHNKGNSYTREYSFPEIILRFLRGNFQHSFPKDSQQLSIDIKKEKTYTGKTLDVQTEENLLAIEDLRITFSLVSLEKSYNSRSGN